MMSSLRRWNSSSSRNRRSSTSSNSAFIVAGAKPGLEQIAAAPVAVGGLACGAFYRCGVAVSIRPASRLRLPLMAGSFLRFLPGAI
jgi:hypothetical protein